MTVSEFVKEYSAAENKKECLKRHVKRYYVPFVEKGEMAERAAKAANFIGGKYKKNTAIANLYHEIDIVNAYTDIEIPKIRDGKVVGVDLMDELCKVFATPGLEGRSFRSVIDDAIGWDIYEFDSVFENACDDLEFNETSMFAINTMTAERIENLLKQLGESVESVLGNEAVVQMLNTFTDSE